MTMLPSKTLHHIILNSPKTYKELLSIEHSGNNLDPHLNVFEITVGVIYKWAFFKITVLSLDIWYISSLQFSIL